MSLSDRSFDFSGVGVQLRGLPEALALSLDQEWGSHAGAAARPLLSLAVEESEATFPGGRVLDDRLDSSFGAGTARFQAVTGGVEVRADGTGLLQLAQGPSRHRLFGLVNLVAAATGWCLSRKRGLVLHAAAAVVVDRAFLLVGPSGAGKSTWARAVAEAGGIVLSDDSVFVETVDVPAALSVPFRVRPFPPVPPGRWPIAAVLLPRHGTPPRLEAVPAVLARARLAASAMYVEPEFRAGAHDARPLSAVAELPMRELTFSPDPACVSLLRAFDGPPRSS